MWNTWPHCRKAHHSSLLESADKQMAHCTPGIPSQAALVPPARAAAPDAKHSCAAQLATQPRGCDSCRVGARSSCPAWQPLPLFKRWQPRLTSACSA